MLPESKTEFPKLLCLDMNKWIDLGRAHYGRPDGAAFKPALAAVRKAVASGSIVVPVTGINAVEVMASGDPSRRRRLAEFMVDLSENHSLVTDAEVVVPEFRAIILRSYLKVQPTSPLRSCLLQRGMTAAIAGRKPQFRTGEPALDAVMDELIDVLYEPEVSIESLVNAISRELVNRFRKDDEETARAVDEVRQLDAHLPINERRRLELTNLLLRESTDDDDSGRDSSSPRSLRDHLRQALTDLRIDHASFFSWLQMDGNAVLFASEAPGIDVTATILLRRDRSAGHKTHRNDAKDLGFLRVAIPYGNIVVTEKSWSHLANSSGLASKYATTVIADASRPPDVLAAEGCI